MKDKLRIILFTLLFIIGSASLFIFQLYIQPKINTSIAVIVTRPVEKNQILTEHDVVLVRLPSEAVSNSAVNNISDVIGKKVNVSLPKEVIIVPELIDMYDMNPGPDEVIVPIIRGSIFAANASLRAGDIVKVAFYKEQSSVAHHEDERTSKAPLSLPQPVKVIAARSEAGNMVMDTEEGNINERVTSTDRVGHIELLLSNQEASIVEERIQQGYKVWIMRVEG